MVEKFQASDSRGPLEAYERTEAFAPPFRLHSGSCHHGDAFCVQCNCINKAGAQFFVYPSHPERFAF